MYILYPPSYSRSFGSPIWYLTDAQVNLLRDNGLESVKMACLQSTIFFSTWLVIWGPNYNWRL